MNISRVLYWLLIYAAYFVSRLYALTLLPIFIDETDQLRRALWISEGERLFHSWNYGKGLGVWVTAAVLPLAADPLWAGRALVVGFGAVTLWACREIAAHLFGARVALAAAGLYILCPYTLMYDRLALSDPVAASFAALALLASLRLARNPRPAAGARAGLALALATLSKVNALPAFAAPAAVAVALRCVSREHRRALAVAYGVAVAVVAYPLWSFLSTPRVVEVGIGATGEAGPWAGGGSKLGRNIGLAWEWLSGYWTLPLLALAALGVALVARERRREAWLLAFLALGPVAAYLPIARIWFPRYLVLSCVPLLVLAAMGLVAAAQRLRSVWPRQGAAPALLGFSLAVIPALRFDFALWTDPPRAPLPRLERYQYLNGWPSGYGVRETVEFFRQALARDPEGLTIVAHGPSRRTTLQALGLYFAREPRVELRLFDLNDPGVREPLRTLAARQPTYLLVSLVHRSKVKPRPGTWGGQVAKRLITRKPDRSVCDEVYALLPDA